MTIKNPLESTWYERIGLLFLAATTAWIWIMSNAIFDDGFESTVHWLSGVNVLTIWQFWIALAIFHVGLFVVATRSLIRNTHNTMTDSIMLGTGIIGMMLISISLVGFFYFGHNQVTWFFGVQQMTIFWVGMLMEVSTMIYYGITE